MMQPDPSNQTSTTAALCEYTLIHDQIHQLCLNTPNRAGVDTLFQLAGALMDDKLPSDPVMRFLFDFPHGMGPFTHTLKAGTAFTKHYDQRPATRSVFLFKDETNLHLIDMLIKLTRLSRDRVRFLNRSQRDAAIEWLLSND
jgi:hypothetical protein